MKSLERLTKIDKYGHPYTNEDINCRNLISEDGINYRFVKLENGVNAYDGKPIDKLYAIENIEEEIGIPLEVLFKALKDGIWTKGGNYDPCFLDATPNFIKNLDLHIGYCGYSQYDSEEFDNYFEENDALCIFTMDYEEHNYVTRLKDYGKTWGLTKEELE